MPQIWSGRMFAKLDDDFWSYGVGAMCWESFEDGEALLVRIPVMNHPDRLDMLRIFPCSEPNNWAEPGPVPHWNGDRERPSFHPSILAPDTWHGYIVDGDLRTDFPPGLQFTPIPCP